MTEQELEKVRSDLIEELVKRYERELSVMGPEELFGQEPLEQMMEEHITFLLEDYEEELNSLPDADLGIEEDDDHEADMDAIDEEEGFVLARLEQRNGGPLPHKSIPELIEWAGTKFGRNDSDVEQLAQLEAEYDALREMVIEKKLKHDAADEGDDQ